MSRKKDKRKRIYLSPPHLSGREIEIVKEAFDSGYIAPAGPQVERFERFFCEVTGFGFAVAVSSGTAALHLAARCLGVSCGDTVIASTLTFIGSINPIIYLGAKPVFIDSDYVSWNMDPNLLEEAMNKLSKLNDKPKAVIVTDIYGQCADLNEINYICNKYDVSVISDSAEALGATYHDACAGLYADAAIFSFNGNKIITTSSGGILASNNEGIIDYAKYLSTQAKENTPYYEHKEIGYNYGMSNILAAIGIGQLEQLSNRVEARRRIFDRYKNQLSGIPGISFMPEASFGRCNRWLTVMLVEPNEFGCDRETIRINLEKCNIETRPVWKPMHLQPVFKGNMHFGGEVSAELFEKGLCLPSGTNMTNEELDFVIDAIKNNYQGSI